MKSPLPYRVNEDGTTVYDDNQDCVALCAIPEGWRLVPVEPTQAMIDAVLELDTPDAYRAMLAAAPHPIAFPADGRENAAAIVRAMNVHDELVAALVSHAVGRCYPCGWPLKASKEEGCVIGDCSYRPTERAHDYHQWRERAEFIRDALEKAAQ